MFFVQFFFVFLIFTLSTGSDVVNLDQEFCPREINGMIGMINTKLRIPSIEQIFQAWHPLVGKVDVKVNSPGGFVIIDEFSKPFNHVIFNFTNEQYVIRTALRINSARVNVNQVSISSTNPMIKILFKKNDISNSIIMVIKNLLATLTLTMDKSNCDLSNVSDVKITRQSIRDDGKYQKLYYQGFHPRQIAVLNKELSQYGESRFIEEMMAKVEGVLSSPLMTKRTFFCEEYSTCTCYKNRTQFSNCRTKNK